MSRYPDKKDVFCRVPRHAPDRGGSSPTCAGRTVHRDGTTIRATPSSDGLRHPWSFALRASTIPLALHRIGRRRVPFPATPPRRGCPRRRSRRHAASADARRLHRPGRRAQEPQGVHRGGEDATGGARPRAVRRPAGAGQDHAGADRGARTRRQLPLDLRPRHRQGRRPRRAADRARGARRALHRRDPPAQPPRRGDPLSGDGGFPARPDDRRGAGRAIGQDRPRQVHAGRRHHARGVC